MFIMRGLHCTCMYNFKGALSAIIMLAASACDHSSATDELSGDQRDDDMHCAPHEVSANTPITITLPKSHGSAMAVEKPNGEFLIFSWDVTEEVNRHKSPVYDIKDSKIKIISIPYDAIGYNYQTYDLRPVFDVTGEYILLLGSTPDLVDALWDFSCTVYFSGKS